MSHIRTLTLAAACLLLVIGTIAPPAMVDGQTLAAAQPLIGPGINLPRSNAESSEAGKYPRIIGRGNTVNIISNPRGEVNVWSKLDTAATVANPTSIGSTPGKTDYATASIASGPDGTLYAVWIIQNSKIVLRRKPVNGGWDGARTIRSTSSFMAQLDIIATGDGQIFITWNQDYAYRYIRSTDKGNHWSSARTVTSKLPYRVLRMATGANNIVVGAFGSNNGHVYAAIWNGSSFITTDLTPIKSSSDFFAEPGAAVAPNGKIYVAWRSAAGGIYYAERQPNGSWPASKLARGDAYGTVGIAADAGNNLHIFWSGNISGGWDMWYAFKPANGAWQGPVRAPVHSSVLANVNGAATVGARAYGHAVAEEFNGSNTVLRYQQFSSSSNIVAATPVLDAGAARTKSNRVSVGFINITGTPDSVRYHWDAAPTNADAWTAFANPLVIDGPTSVSADACSTHVLYTQVRQGSTVGETTGQDSESFDTGVQAQVLALNPHYTYRPGPATNPSTEPGNPGASDGDPRYTRDPRFYLSINGLNDCSHLKDFTVAGSSPVAISANGIYNGDIALASGIAAGSQSINVQVADQLGNTKDWAFSLIYDPPTAAGLPVLKSGGKLDADSGNSIIRTLSFQDISVSDNLYGQSGENLPAGKQFWGVEIANTRSPTATADTPDLHWYPVRVTQPDSSFSVKWDLFSGLGYTSDLANKPGDYYIFVRFLDGAGNPSTRSLTTKVTLDAGYTLPIQRMPAMFR